MRLFGEQSRAVRGLKTRVAIVAVVAATLIATLGASFVDASAAGGSKNPKVVNAWNKIAVDLIVGTPTIGGTARAFNYFAYEQAAVYNAVVGITRKYQLYQWSHLGPRNASPAAAAVAASHRLLVHYFPGSQASLDTAYNASLAGLPRGMGKLQGIAYGNAAADNIIELRANDGLNDASIVFTTAPAPGVWRPQTGQTFLAPWLSQVHPFTLTSTAQLDPGPPPQMDTALYATEFNEVKDLGRANSATRTAAQTETVRFFFDTAAGPLQAGLRDLASRHHLDISDRARMFAAVDISMADTIGAVWYAKFKYHWWRPITAIQEAASDGNAATDADATWTSLIPSPPYPDWVSGLCSVYGAAGRALTRVMGNDIDLKITSPGSAPGGAAGVPIPRTYHSAAAINTDAINARVWSGIHFRTADQAGNTIGIEAADWALDHNFGKSQ